MADANTVEGPAGNGQTAPLASGAVTVYRAPEPGRIFPACPSLEVMPGGRIVLACEQSGPGVKTQPGRKGHSAKSGHWSQGLVFSSGDQGKTWQATESFPFRRPFLFRDAHTLYLMGVADDLEIASSVDGGLSWSKPARLKTPSGLREGATVSPVSALAANGALYLACMYDTAMDSRGHETSTLAPLVMRAAQGSNLLQAKSWAFSEPVTPFRDLVQAERLEYMGIPFFAVPHPTQGEPVSRGRWAHRMGWENPHLVQIRDPDHVWFDPSGKTLHLVAQAETHRSNMAAMAKLVEDERGAMRLMLETTPGGTRCAFLTLPGGNLKFHLFHDDVSKLYWLLGNQVRDSMTRPDKLTPDRFGLPHSDRQRLQLHLSRNLVDWWFAGFVDAGATPREARCDGTMAVRKDDLFIAYCCGDARGRNAGDLFEVRVATIRNFRRLAG